MGTGFYGSNDPTNSVKALKEESLLAAVLVLVTQNNVPSTVDVYSAYRCPPNTTKLEACSHTEGLVKLTTGQPDELSLGRRPTVANY